MHRVSEQPAYLLHSRPYRDSSRLCEFFSRDYGRVAAVMRGVRNANRRSRAAQAALQPFVPLLLGWTGRGELKTVTSLEADQPPRSGLQGRQLFSGLYVNEITERLLHRDDAHGNLYAAYVDCVAGLAADGDAQPVLRRYEFALLEELGYGVCLDTDADSGEPLDPDASYVYLPEHGLSRRYSAASGEVLFAGGDLLDAAAGEWHRASLGCAKQLARIALAPLLGEVPLRSRDLFQQFNRGAQV